MGINEEELEWLIRQIDAKKWFMQEKEVIRNDFEHAKDYERNNEG